jgi:hypothetical protein
LYQKLFGLRQYVRYRHRNGSFTFSHIPD